MNFRNLTADSNLRPALQDTLRIIRAQKAFDAAAWCQAKATRINDYFLAHGLRATVIATSGGLDSSVGLGLLVFASQQAGSPLKKIVPLLMPVNSPGAASNQDVTTRKGLAICEYLGVTPLRVDLSQLHGLAKLNLDMALGIPGQESAAERLGSDLRTPMLYYATSLLAQAGLPALVVGTVNRDKGSYLGYFGKAGAGMCDLQILTDLHRAELQAVARTLGLPETVCSSAPNADFADGRRDEEVFGTSYEFVELFLTLKAASPEVRQDLCDAWGPLDRKQFVTFSTRLEKLHRYNGHKLLSGSPAIHLDVLNAHVPEGWHYAVVESANVSA
jgi:NAD+ synthase (glutamine-hydrolysing)